MTDQRPLAGFTVGVTAERRADDLIAALERKGAGVRHAPTIRLVPLADDEQLREATDAVVAAPIDLAIFITGQGFRGWMTAARAWGVADELLARFAGARVVVRGPKAKGAVRGEGLAEEWSSPEETNADLLEYVVARGVAGKRIALQVHGAPLPEFVERLVSAGAHVIEAQPYRWLPPVDVERAFRLVDDAVGGVIDVMTFTSAPAAANLLTLAREHERESELLSALRERVICACVGPVTAAPLVEMSVPVIMPERQRLGALVKLIASELPLRAG